jgi:tryptophan 2,3-dioxygenase
VSATDDRPRDAPSPQSPAGESPAAAPGGAAGGEPQWDAHGRRTDGRWLSYADYVNVRSILEAQRLPEEVPKGRTRDEWPTRPTVAGDAGERPWRPGDRWPAGWPRDEHLFLVTHQAFELWFKQILHDLDDTLDEARAIGKAHGVGMPRADETPGGEYPTLTSGSLRLFPATAAAAEALGPDEKSWLLEMAVPGFARRPSRAWSLAWIEPSRLRAWAAKLSRSALALTHAMGAFEVLATMPPEAFLEFRSRLVPASGFGSLQFREIEIVSGLGSARAAMAAPPAGTRVAGMSTMTEPSAKTPREAAELALARHLPRDDWARLDRRLGQESLRDLLAALLDAPEICGKDDAEFRARIDEVASSNVAALHADYVRESMHPQGDLKSRMSTRWQEIGRLLARPENVGLCWLHRRADRGPGFVAFLDAAFQWDQAISRWRREHVAFVERMIGARPGTGGGGVEYLRKTLELPRAFPWLWDFRTILMG